MGRPGGIGKGSGGRVPPGSRQQRLGECRAAQTGRLEKADVVLGSPLKRAGAGLAISYLAPRHAPPHHALHRAGSEPGSGSRRAGLSEQLVPATRIYRLGSAGQDCQLCLWDVQAPGEADINSTAAMLAQLSMATGGMK